MRIASVAAGLILLASCASDRLVSIDGYPSRALAVTAGQQLDLTLKTVGAGQYASPPGISSAAVRFVGDSSWLADPGGLTQRFRFTAVATGRAVITFQPTGLPGLNPVVADTVIVR